MKCYQTIYYLWTITQQSYILMMYCCSLCTALLLKLSHLFRKVMRFELNYSVSLETVYVCQLRYSGNLLFLLLKVVTLPGRMRGGRVFERMLFCGCVEMSALSEMTTSVSERTEQSQTLFSLWHHRWGSQQGRQFVPAPGAFFVMMTRVALELDRDNQCISHRPPSSPSCYLLSDTCHLGCVWPNDVQAKEAVYYIIVSRAVTSQF